MKDAPTPRFSAADRIKLALALTAAILVVEIAGGLWAHSLALLSDAGHLVTDLLVLGFSAFALFQGRRPANPRKTFGYRRVGILVALGNALILGVVVVAIVVEAVRRLEHPTPVQSGVMLGAAAVALTVSLVNSRNLQQLAGDMSIRSALIHIRGDALAAAAVIVGAVVIAVSGQPIADPILSLGIAALIAWSAWQVLAEVRELLAHRFQIEHTTIQFEGVVCKPGDVFCIQPDGHPHLDEVHDR